MIIKLKYPLGKFKKPDVINLEVIENWIYEIELFPSRIWDLVKGLGEGELKWRYRPGGWTIQQLVHHCADSHMNAFCRMKLALTEDEPTIKPYFEDRWAQLKDYELPLDASLAILEGLHTRWEILLKSISNSDLNRKFVHPEGNRRISIVEAIGMYAWHCEHHLAHIMLSKKIGND